MSTIEMTKTAAAMAMAHCVAHPSRACVGVFLGPATEASSSASASHVAGSMTSVVRATAAIPLFHGDLTTTPYAEMAMEQIATHAAERGLVMIGAWRASERNVSNKQTNALETVVAGALEVIRRSRGSASMAFCVDFTSSALEAFARSNEDGSSSAATFPAFAYDDAVGDWRPSTTARVERGSEEETRKLVARSLLPLSDARAIEVCDFDDHFDDLRKDWRNPNFGVA